MFRKKRLVFSFVALVASISIMMLGVYSAVSPSVNIGGQVSYSVTDAKLLVQGKLTGAKNVDDGSYPTAESVYTDSTKVTDKNNQYLDFTTGGGKGNSDDDLSPWTLGALDFEEIDGGFVNPISVSMKVTNFSAYNVKATVTMSNDIENVTRTVKKGSKQLSEVSDKTYSVILPACQTTAKSVEICIEYKVTDSSKGVTTQNINFHVDFEWTSEQDTSLTAAQVMGDTGIITMGKTTVYSPDAAPRFYTEMSSYEQDVKWIAYAYKNANGEIKAITYSDTDGSLDADSLADVCENAVSLYFAMYECMPVSFLEHDYVATEKIDSETGYHNGTSADSSVLFSDYYYSDIRQKIRSAQSELIASLNIDSTSAIFQNIQSRSISDLYANNKVTDSYYIDSPEDYTDVELPTGADEMQQDMFWLLSGYEICGFMQSRYLRCFPYSGGRNYWLTWTRSFCEDMSFLVIGSTHWCEGCSTVERWTTMNLGDSSNEIMGVRIGFELALG